MSTWTWSDPCPPRTASPTYLPWWTGRRAGRRQSRSPQRQPPTWPGRSSRCGSPVTALLLISPLTMARSLLQSCGRRWRGIWGSRHTTPLPTTRRLMDLVEHFHCSMKAALRAGLTDGNWLDKLPWVMLGLRTAPKEDLRSSSAELVFGQPLRVPGDFIPKSTEPWSASAQRASLLNSARAFALVPTTQHGVPASRVPTELQSAGYVFIRHRDAATTSLRRTLPCRRGRSQELRG